jgi:hypothetical protein
MLREHIFDRCGAFEVSCLSYEHNTGPTIQVFTTGDQLKLRGLAWLGMKLAEDICEMNRLQGFFVFSETPLLRILDQICCASSATERELSAPRYDNN